MRSSRIPTLSQYEGCYFGQKKTIYGVEKGYVRIKYGPKGLEFHGIDANGQKKDVQYLSGKTFQRWYNGAIVNESTSVGLLGGTEKNAQVFKLDGNKLTRHVYMNYWFKGLFGGYWFAEKEIHHWEKTDNKNCADI